MMSEKEFLKAQSHSERIADYRASIKLAKKTLQKSFARKETIHSIISAYSSKIDKIIIDAFNSCSCQEFTTLIAVGGYGRSELFPYSDIDILLLTQNKLSKHQLTTLEGFIQLLWDCQFDVGHSVRTFDETIELANNDITIISNLIEMRYLSGDEALAKKLATTIQHKAVWSDQDFFNAKMEEQKFRYHKYGDSAFNLQPDVKNGPGGMRDLQMIGWISKRYFATMNLSELIAKHFLTREEYSTLVDCQHFLWQVNLALQLHCDAKKSRLLFDHQMQIAKILGFSDTRFGLAIEHFMKKYYRTIKTLRQLSDMLLQMLREAIFTNKKRETIRINDNFRINNHYLEVCHKTVFQKHPAALLEIFVLLAKHPEVKGVNASTIRLIREHRYLINTEFRLNPEHNNLFLALLRQSINVSEQLQRMNLYGILGKYIPAFGQVIGQMQYDLFHIYTVDQHSIYIVRNLRRFTLSTYNAQFPLCYEVMQSIIKPELLYIAALFHDLGKGRGGDHSTLGANDARDFCAIHKLNPDESDLIVWLIENHLLMSMTAQRKDIYDPLTIKDFTDTIQTQQRLDHLYLLTVADICATNPTLWNSWRDALLRELYQSCKNLLNQQQKTLDPAHIILEKKRQASERIIESGYDSTSVQQLWSSLSQAYFLREATANIVWQTKKILSHTDNNKPLILLKEHHRQGGTEIFIYTKNNPYLFAKNSTAISNLRLNIVEARIYTSSEKYALHCYVILDENNQTIHDADRLAALKHYFQTEYQVSDAIPRIRRHRISSTHRHFNQKPEYHFNYDANRNCTVMNIVCPDRPGLLATISQALLSCHVLLHTAKIATMGERIEDTFFITDEHLQALSKTEQETLEQTLNEKLDRLINF